MARGVLGPSHRPLLVREAIQRLAIGGWSRNAVWDRLDRPCQPHGLDGSASDDHKLDGSRPRKAFLDWPPKGSLHKRVCGRDGWGGEPGESSSMDMATFRCFAK